MPDEDAIAAFELAWEALVAGDVGTLEELSRDSSFPHGTDPWLGRHWLTTAIHSGNLTSIAWVLGRNPEVNYLDDEGFSPLTSALGMEHAGPAGRPAATVIRIIDLLLAAGASINQRLTLDETALHEAARRSSGPVLRHLLSKGADPLAVSHDYSPRTPADLAKALKRWEAQAILREAMEAVPPPSPPRRWRPPQR